MTSNSLTWRQRLRALLQRWHLVRRPAKPRLEPVMSDQMPTAPPPQPVATILTDADYARAAAALGVDVATVKAVAEIEAAGRAFLPDNIRPTILYEAHIFGRETAGKYSNAKDANGVALSSPSWNRELYGPPGAHQWDRLEAAAKLNWDAAHASCSWGLFQILGTNFKAAGHNNVRSFVDAMCSGVGAQLDAFVAFVKANHLDAALQRQDWAAFAHGYNGPGYKQNAYDTKLAGAFSKWNDVMLAQASPPQAPPTPPTV